MFSVFNWKANLYHRASSLQWQVWLVSAWTLGSVWHTEERGRSNKLSKSTCIHIMKGPLVFRYFTLSDTRHTMYRITVRRVNRNIHTASSSSKLGYFIRWRSVISLNILVKTRCFNLKERMRFPSTWDPLTASLFNSARLFSLRTGLFECPCAAVRGQLAEVGSLHHRSPGIELRVISLGGILLDYLAP